MEREKHTALLWGLLYSALNDSPAAKPTIGTLSDDEWRDLIALARFNRVSALCCHAASLLDSEQRPARGEWLQWVAFRDIVEQKANVRNGVAHELTMRMRQHGIETLVLKGPRLAACYPHPELREYDDLDFYHFGRGREADSVASMVLGLNVCTDDPHHSTYAYHGVTIENHHTFCHNRHAPSNDDYEALLKRLVPSATFDALYLLRHMASHFAASHATVKSICDWAMFVRSKGADVDWTTVGRAVRQSGMQRFVSAIQLIAVARLGAEALIPIEAVDNEVAQRIENDMVYGEFAESTHPQAGLRRAWWKWRRYRANRWKRQLVYRDAEIVMLLRGIGHHLSKPRQITHKH